MLKSAILSKFRRQSIKNNRCQEVDDEEDRTTDRSDLNEEDFQDEFITHTERSVPKRSLMRRMVMKWGGQSVTTPIEDINLPTIVIT